MLIYGRNQHNIVKQLLSFFSFFFKDCQGDNNRV